MGRAGQGARPGGAGPVARADLQIDFRTAAVGGERALSFEDGRTLTVRIPPGVRDGETIRIDREGLALTLHVAPHPVFERSGEDLHVEVPVTVGEAVRGAVVSAPTLDGVVRVRVPPGTQTGRRLRLRGKGIARRGQPPGDLYAAIVVRLPEGADPADLEEALRSLDEAYSGDPRRSLLQQAAA